MNDKRTQLRAKAREAAKNKRKRNRLVMRAVASSSRVLEQVDLDKIDAEMHVDHMVEFWRSEEFVVTVHHNPDDFSIEGVGFAGWERMTVTRMPRGDKVVREGDAIRWDDLQRLKRETGRSSRCAYEIYPGDQHLAGAAQTRHLWITPVGHALEAGWWV